MQKIGSVILNIEPHVLEATMYGVKDNSKPATPATNSSFRPIMQYGPPNGVMPPPPKPPTPATPSTPSAVPASPSQAAAQPQTQSATPTSARPPTPSQSQGTKRPTEPQRSHPAAPANPPPASRGLDSVLAAPSAPQPSAQVPPPARAPPTSQAPLRSPVPPTSQAQPLASPLGAPAAVPPGTTRPPHPAPSPSPTTATGASTPGAPKPAAPAAKPATTAPSGADPIIVTLAEKASEDPHLRDLMKRVAVGDAAPNELAHFQKIIDQITADYKKKGGQQGPSADRLLVDGRTVKYFADEVRAILDIVLSSNPNQKASDLRPPPGCDPLVILLVKKALEDHTTRNMVRRVAENKTKFSDATDLKAVLDRLRGLVPKDSPKAQPAAGHAQTSAARGPEATTNGTPTRKQSVPHVQTASTSQQALRSKGPPAFKTEYSAIVLEFSGGTGDRYLFPKYSILEYQPGSSQVLASFLIVRKGSKSEYGGDPALDYYQPITMRISSPSGKHLEQLARVVAPQDEVRRYMDDIMDNMTRAEYILLAMRLPRPQKEDQTEERAETAKPDSQQQQTLPQPPQGVLWTTKVTTAKMTSQSAGKVLGEDEQYQNFVATVS